MSDFGLSRKVDPSSSGSLTVCGTPVYMAPEVKQAFDSKMQKARYNGKAADVFSLGIVFYEMATSRNPNSEALLDKMINGSEMPDDDLNAVQDVHLRHLVGQMVRRRSEDRIGADAGSQTYKTENILKHQFYAK